MDKPLLLFFFYGFGDYSIIIIITIIIVVDRGLACMDCFRPNAHSLPLISFTLALTIILMVAEVLVSVLFYFIFRYKIFSY